MTAVVWVGESGVVGEEEDLMSVMLSQLTIEEVRFLTIRLGLSD
jgi:hypothetical protein